MLILAIERPIPGVADAQFTPDLAAAEARRAWELYQAGTFRDLYFRADQSSAVLVLECGDVVADARGPGFAAAGSPWLDRLRGPAAACLPGFERLFAPGALSSELR
jgi:hypothetical protein